MTGESQGKTDEFMEETGAKFAYAYDGGLKLFRSLGLSGFPSAVLVDPSGEIVWSGHPASLQSNIVESHLGGALKTPVWEWPRSTASVKKALAKGDFAKAHEEAQALVEEGDEGATEIAAAIENMIQSKVKSVEAAYEAGDYLAAYEKGQALEKGLKGRDAEVERVEAVVDAIKGDRDAKATMKGQKILSKLKADPPANRRDLEKLTPKLQALAKRYEGTIVARQADAWRKELIQQLNR